MKGCHLMKLTDIIGATLKKYKINEVFGLQGGAVVHIFDSIEKYGVKTVYTLHEQAAALASVANAKVTGKFGCAVVTTGPGTTNAITGLLGAWNDSIPCIFISGQVRSDHVSYNKPVRQVGTQEAPICNIVKPITKLSIFIKDPSTFQEELEKAICIACEGRPGPVWIDIPLEYQWLDVPYKSNYIKQPDNKNYDNDKINTFEKFLMESKKPLLVLGYGIRLSDTIDLCKDFVNKTNIPFVTTWTAQDIFTTSNMQNLGVIGMSGQKGANKAMFSSDLLICLGTHLSIPHTTTLFEDYAPNAKKIIVNIDQDQLDNLNLDFDLKIHMDLKNFFEKITNKYLKISFDQSFQNKLFKDLNWYKPEDNQVNSNLWNRKLTSNAPNKSCFIVDGGGTALYSGFQSTIIKSKNQRIICSSSMSSMGSGLAETIGVFFSKKFDQLYCIIGDGSFFMNIQDLHTIKQYKIPVIISVINNNGYLAIRHTQADFQENRFYGTHPEWGLTMPNIESVSLGFGIKYLKIEHNNEIEFTVNKLKSINEPIVCEIITSENQPVLFKQKYNKNGPVNFIPQSLSDMEP
jgi:acetolactate synthase I/II/III large subunit